MLQLLRLFCVLKTKCEIKLIFESKMLLYYCVYLFVFLTFRFGTVSSDGETSMRGLRHIMSQTDKEKLKDFIDATVNKTSANLTMPFILEPSTSPSRFLKDETSGSSHQVEIQSKISNSKAALSFPWAISKVITITKLSKLHIPSNKTV